MNTEETTSDYLTKREAADYLKVSVRTMDNLMANRSLPFVKIGSRIVRFSKSAINHHLAETTSVTKPINR